MFTLVACMSEDNVIGIDNAMPWRMPSDMKHFKNLTIGHRVVMGSTTFAGLREPLPLRHNWVLSRKHSGAKDLDTPTPVIYSTFERVLSEFAHSVENVFVIGGREVYELFMPHADKMILTHLDVDYGADEQPSLAYNCVKFPFINPAEWHGAGRCDYKAGAGDDFDYSITSWLRTAPPTVNT